jgi:hypothetical protein
MPQLNPQLRGSQSRTGAGAGLTHLNFIIQFAQENQNLTPLFGQNTFSLKSGFIDYEGLATILMHQPWEPALER